MLFEIIVFIIAAILAVPISKKIGFGSVLGYLAAGIIIGPYGLQLIEDAENILHFAELGVVFLLFIIGLELQPSRLWVLRRMVFGLGTLQVLVSAVAIFAIARLAGFETVPAAVIGLILALSSTAFVLQMLAEQNELTTSYGRAAFTVLLFQDLAVIPMIALLPLLGDASSATAEAPGPILTVAVIAGLIIGGRYLLRPIFRVVAGTDLPELFTAVALLVVLGSAMLMELVHIPMELGAFLAGMLLADSEFRHELEANIAPFKGLLLGLFFIAVGMTVNLELLVSQPVAILTTVIVLMTAKAIVLFPLARLFGLKSGGSALVLSVLLSQGGEFAFVLFGIAARSGILEATVTNELILAVAISMMLTPVLYVFARRMSASAEAVADRAFDDMPQDHNEVIIAGFGRVGQIVGRILRMAGKPFTALESDTSQVDFVRRFGNKVYYGDASRIDLLRAAGADHAKIFVLAVQDLEASVRIAETVIRHFPNLTIVARARNRRHEYKLMDLGIKNIWRETLLSSIDLSKHIMRDLGVAQDDVEHIANVFRERDRKLIIEQHAIHDDEEKLIQTSQETARELDSLMRREAD